MNNENISMIGIGRLGLCASLIYEKNGYNVLGVDINKEYVDKINNKTLDNVMHAEINAIKKVGYFDRRNSTLFVTHSPCIHCAKLIHQSGIRRVYFGQHYRDSAGVDFLTKSGVDVVQI